MTKEHFERPEVIEQLRGKIQEAIEKAFTGDFVDRLTERMINGLWSDK